MFDHVTIRVSDRAASRAFYELLLDRAPSCGDHYDEWNDFSLAQADTERPPTKRLHVAFVTRSRGEVDALWRAVVDGGHPSDGEPGVRPEYGEEYYGGFVIDPDGNSAEVVYHGREREGDNLIDHLWIRVADLDAQKRFWRTVAPVLGVRIANELQERFHVAARDRSFALVRDGEATANVHVAFPVADDATVAEFHRVALAAGYRDNGTPGKRPEYHAGYVGAFVFDPDGNNVEAVNHNR